MIDSKSILLAREARQSLENPTTPLSAPDEWLWDALGASKSDAGVRVNERTVFDSTPFLGATVAIADVAGMLPLPVYEQLEPRGKRRAREHFNYRLLHDESNPFQTAFSFRQMYTAQCIVWGNAYAEIERNDRREPVALWPIPPAAVTPRIIQPRSLVYEVRIGSGVPVLLDSGSVLHISWLNVEEIVRGISAARVAKHSIGAALAAQKFSGKFFAQGGVPPGWIKHPKTLSESALKRLRAQLDRNQSLDESHRIRFLEEGMDWLSSATDPQKSQLTEVRQFQVPDQIRHLRVPAHMVADLTRSTNNNIEQQSLEFVMYGMGPWFARVEQEFNRKLFPTEARGKFFCEFVVQALLRGDTAARKDFYAAGRQWGWLSANDIRELENQPLRTDPEGDTYLTPQNITGKAAEPVGGDSATRRVLRHLAERAAWKELSALRGAIQKFGGDLEGFRAWALEFYSVHEVQYGGLFPGAAALREPLLRAARPETVVDAFADSRVALLMEGIV